MAGALSATGRVSMRPGGLKEKEPLSRKLCLGKNVPTVLFLVKEIAKLERERFVFCPRLFREGGGLS